MMARLGQVSYAFYLWQGPVFLACDELKISLALNMVLAFGGTLLMAVVTTRLIEIPALRLRDRLTSSKPSVPAMEPQLKPV
jgi:peptidoglycan/LPS O-acetylase OafA/YrhL